MFETIQLIHRSADIAIVSSANSEALQKEWAENNLMQFVKYVFGQEKGSKKECIANLIEQGYSKNKMIMLGDSPGDYKAAFDNEVWFYPILFNHEKESWDKFKNVYFDKFVNNHFNEEIQNELLNSFNNNMNK